jgi:hypothetical protein
MDGTMNISDLSLVELSVTLRDINQYRHDTNYVNPRLLALEGIVPENWNWEKGRYLAIHGKSMVTYENENILFGGGDFLTVSQRSDLELGKGPELTDGIIKYVKLLAPDIFDKAEIGWQLHLERKSPSTWITSRFFQPNLIPKNWKEPQAIPAFNFQSKDSVIFYRFSVDQERRNVAISCQAHTASPVDDVGLSEWLSNYHDHETAVLTNLLQLTEI